MFSDRMSGTRVAAGRACPGSGRTVGPFTQPALRGVGPPVFPTISILERETPMGPVSALSLLGPVEKYGHHIGLFEQELTTALGQIERGL